jgi:polysaccharide export outer membrane protein
LERLRAELGSEPERDRASPGKSPIPPALAAEFEKTETAFMKLRATDLAEEKEYLRESVTQEDHRIATLSQQQQQEAEGVKADAEELQRLQELFKKGGVTTPRVVEARRTILLSSTRELQTTAELAQVERQRGEIQHRLERIDDQRRLEILKEMQDVNLKLGTTRARIASVSEKLLYTGMIKSQLVRGSGSEPKLIVFRKGDSGHDRLVVDENTELRPGDVVEIALQASLVPEATAHH